MVTERTLRSLAMAVVVMTTSCARNELAREHVARLLEDHETFRSITLTAKLDKQTLERGYAVGWWRERRSYGRMWALGYSPPWTELTDEGRRYVSALAVDLPEPRATFAAIARRRITKITGIAGTPFGEGLKEVQFAWGLDDVPPWLEPDTASHASGTALLRRYDSGWRVEGAPKFSDLELRMNLSNVPTTAMVRRDNAAECYGGTWREDQDNGLRWRFEVVDETLRIERTDRWVTGSFTGDMHRGWTGNLTWGNGDVWKHVRLFPAENCTTIRTNQAWSYRR